MLFTQSLNGLSHNKLEDTAEEHLRMAVEALLPSGVEDDRLDRIAASDRSCLDIARPCEQCNNHLSRN